MQVVTYQGVAYETRTDESVLDVLLRHEIDIPYSCKAGVCNTCIMVREEGELSSTATLGLKDTLVDQGYFLACQCVPSGPVTVRKSDYFSLFSQAIVIDKELLSTNVCRIRLQSSTDLYYHAGQYINLRSANGQIRSYSLASLPTQNDYLELHIKRMKNGQVSNWLFDEVNVNDNFDIQGPFGECYYLPGNIENNILLIATGTGLAPLVGIIRDAIDSGHKGDIKLYHGDRTAEALYLNNYLKEIASTHANFEYFPCVTTPMKKANKGILQGRASDHALAQNMNLKGASVYLCGSPTMVTATRKQAYLNGANMKNIYVDPFVTKDLRQGKIRDRGF